jgi:hypothetical protein
MTDPLPSDILHVSITLTQRDNTAHTISGDVDPKTFALAVTQPALPLLPPPSRSFITAVEVRALAAKWETTARATFSTSHGEGYADGYGDARSDLLSLLGDTP